MYKSKITPKATLVATVAAGVVTEVIVSEGIVYVPLLDASQLLLTKSSGAVAATEEKPSKQVAEEKSEKPTAKGKKYTEDDLMEMDAKTELTPWCEELGIEIPDEGKNTNAKLRKLLLAYQKENGGLPEPGSAGKPKEVEEEKPKGAKAAPKASGASKAIEKILDAVNDGDTDRDDGEEELLELVETKAAKTALKKVYAKFIEEEDEPVSKFVKLAAAIVDEEAGAGEEEEDEKPKGGRGGKTQEKEKSKGKILTYDEAVEDGGLEEGMKVDVQWLSEGGEFFPGAVETIDDDGVYIAYDDGTSSYLKRKDNPKIKVLG
jgi:hypothetical protein